MTNLEEIITTLKTRYVIIIENDLHFEEDNNKILAKYLSLSNFARTRLNESLAKLDLNIQSQNLEEFRVSFNALKHTEHKEALLPDDLQEYLQIVNGMALITDKLYTAIEDLKKSVHGKEALLRNGIHKFADDRYDSLIKIFSNIEGLELTFYHSAPVPAIIDTFIDELIDGIQKTGSVYYLAIIDKMLGEGADESGRRFIIEDLMPQNKEKGLKGLAFLFTSMANVNHPIDFENYFIREVEKGHLEVTETVAKYLTDIAYASVFKSFADDFEKSSQDALKIALRNQNNVRHIIAKSVNEGISAFDTLKNWFKLIIQKKFDDYQLNELNYYGALTHFFDIDKLQDHNNFSEFGVEMEKLNSFELFDFNINQKGLPLSPGDIFKKNEDFYILIGQACDLLIRNNGSRGGKIAEFLKIKLDSFPDGKAEKFTINVNNGTKTVNISHFFDGEKFVIAKINITSKNTYLGDFKCLDLCNFNIDGQSKISTQDISEYSQLHWMNESKFEYIRSLHTYFIENEGALAAAKEIIDPNVNVFSSADFIKDKEYLNFGFSRFARLKGRFYDSLYQQVIHYKSRIDLNLIDQAVETSKEIELVVKFQFLEIEEIVKTELTRIKSTSEFIDSTKLLEVVSDVFKSVVRTFHKFEISKNTTGYTLSVPTEDNEKYVLLLPIKYIDKSRTQKTLTNSFIKFQKLFEVELREYKFTYIDNQEEGVLNNEKQINISDIKRGIRFRENGVTLKLENGSIKSYEE